jgi:hypothetical protein
MESTVIYLGAMKRPLSVLNRTVRYIEHSEGGGAFPSKGHYRELRACRRSRNRKSINLRRIAGVSEAGAPRCGVLRLAWGGKREPAAEILSVLSEGTRSCPAPGDRPRLPRAFDLAGITNTVILSDGESAKCSPFA